MPIIRSLSTAAAASGLPIVISIFKGEFLVHNKVLNLIYVSASWSEIYFVKQVLRWSYNADKSFFAVHS
jgi:hypothetical protein